MRTKGGPWSSRSTTPVESVSRVESGIRAWPRSKTGSPLKRESSGPFSQAPRPLGRGGVRPGSPRKPYFRVLKLEVLARSFFARAKASPAVRRLSTRGSSGNSSSMKLSFSPVLALPNTASLAATEATAPPLGRVRRISPNPSAVVSSNFPTVQLK